MIIKSHGFEETVILKVREYAEGGSLCPYLFCTDWEPYGPLTRNLGVKVPPFCGYLDVNNLTNAQEFVREYGLGEPYLDPRTNLLVYGRSGFVTYPLYKFYPEKLKEHDPDGYEEYMAHLAM